MTNFPRIFRLGALALWIGSLIFFAFVVAPVAFTVLPSHHMAGTVVALCLRRLHWIGLVSGLVFLLFAVLSYRRSTSRAAQLTLVCSMLSITAVSQFLIIPRMEQDRLFAGGAIDNVAHTSQIAQDFDRLHHLSERLEGAVLLFGLVAFVLAAAESDFHTDW